MPPYAPIEVWTPLAQGTVTSGGTSAPAAGTSESWTVSVAAAFPAAVNGAQHFYVADPAANSETIEIRVCAGGTGSQSWTAVRGADGTSPVTHAGGFTVVQVMAAQTQRDARAPAYRFFPEAYGAKGDGVIGTGGTGTSGTTAFSDTGAAWTAADAGKCIVINQGTSGAGSTNGTSQAPFCGTISSVTDATHIVLSANLGAACASAPYCYGTDDQPAVQAAVTAAAAYAQGVNGNSLAEVAFRPAIYMLKALTQTTSPKVNTHISVPYGTQTGQRLAMRFTGAGAPQIEYWSSTVPHLNGPCLFSAILPAAQPDATFGQVSVLGGPSAQLGSGQFANVRLEVDGLTFAVPWNSQMHGVDGRWIAQMIVPAAHYTAFVPVNTGAASIGGPYAQNVPGNGIAAGFAFPWSSNNAANYGGLVTGETVPFAVLVSEHTAFTRLTGLYCKSACHVSSAPSLPHALAIQLLLVEGSQDALSVDPALTGVNLPVNVAMIESEFMTNSIVNDPNSILTGLVRTAAAGASFPTVIGGTKLIVIDDLLHSPGPWSGAPAVPATTVAQQNLSYRHATIYVRATTSVSSIAIGPTSGSMTSVTVTAGANVAVPVRVPPGWFWSATYSGTATAPWWLD